MADAIRSYELPTVEIESRLKGGRKEMGNALKANPQDVRQQYRRQLKDLQEACGKSDAGVAHKKKLQSLLGEDEK